MTNTTPPVPAAGGADAERRRNALRQLLERHNMNPTDLARLIGLKTPNVFFNFLAGRTASLSHPTLEKIVAAFRDGSAGEFIGQRPGRPSLIAPPPPAVPGYRVVHVNVVAQAGVWRRDFHLPAIEHSTILVPEAFGIDGPEIFGVRVEAPGAEDVFPASTVLICGPTPADLATLQPRTRVVIQTIRNGRTEVTIRQAVPHGGETWLWPLSSHPDHQAPVRAPWHRTALERAQTGLAVKIAAFVYASWQPEWPLTAD